MPHVKNMLHIKIYTQHNFPTLQHYRAVSPYQPAQKITFEFLLRISEFYFLFSATPMGFYFLFAYQPAQKITFEFLLRISEFYFLFSATPMGFYFLFAC